MTDQMQSAREDLAFMKAIAEDKEPLPWKFGAHLLAAGVIFAPCAFIPWASLSGLAPAPGEWLRWDWVPSMALYTVVWIFLARMPPRGGLGPNKRLFGVAWGAMGAMSITALIALGIVQAKLGGSILEVWPSVALTLYGGTWTVLALTHLRWWHGAVAAGCFVMAIWCAFLVGTPMLWFAMGLGVLAWIAVPGLVIVLRAPR